MLLDCCPTPFSLLTRHAWFFFFFSLFMNFNDPSGIEHIVPRSVFLIQIFKKWKGVFKNSFRLFCCSFSPIKIDIMIISNWRLIRIISAFYDAWILLIIATPKTNWYETRLTNFFFECVLIIVLSGFLHCGLSGKIMILQVSNSHSKSFV